MSRLNFIQRENLRLWNLCQCYVTGCYGAIRAMSARVGFGGLALLVFVRVCR